MKTNDHKALKQSYREIVEIVTTVVNEWDPYDLISAGAPDNEFSHEVTQIVAKINTINTPIALAGVISSVFSKELESESFSIEECMPVASRLFTALKARMRTTLPCPKCSKEFTPREILEASTISWPELCWIYFKCPACEKFTHIQIINGRMSTVNFLGAPGPDWEINTSIEIMDFKIRMDHEFAHAWLDGKHYEYEAKK